MVFLRNNRGIKQNRELSIYTGINRIQINNTHLKNKCIEYIIATMAKNHLFKSGVAT